MPRPRCRRRIDGAPACLLFKPAGRPAARLEEIVLSLEEFEAIRLADHEGLYQEEAARRMGVSRQTFGRAVAGARAKVARALVLGCALRVAARPECAGGGALEPSGDECPCPGPCGHEESGQTESGQDIRPMRGRIRHRHGRPPAPQQPNGDDL